MRKPTRRTRCLLDSLLPQEWKLHSNPQFPVAGPTMIRQDRIDLILSKTNNRTLSCEMPKTSRSLSGLQPNSSSRQEELDRWCRSSVRSQFNDGLWYGDDRSISGLWTVIARVDRIRAQFAASRWPSQTARSIRLHFLLLGALHLPFDVKNTDS